MNEVIFHEFDRDYYCESRYIDEIVSAFCEIRDGYAVVISSNLRQLPVTDREKIVIVTGDEAGALPRDPYPGQNVRCVFRIFNRSQTANGFHVFPIPPGYNWTMHHDRSKVMKGFYPNQPLDTREYDVFFAGQVVAPREVMLIQAERLKTDFHVYLGTNPSFRTGLDIDDYYQLLGRTKVALVPAGTSEDTFRYVEAMASGCIVVTLKKEDLWYYTDAPVVFLNDWSELTADLLRDIVSRDLGAWRHRVLEYYSTRLSGRAVANYMSTVLDLTEKRDYFIQRLLEQESQLVRVDEQLTLVRSSKEYRLGRFLLRPVRSLVNRIRGRKN